MTDRTSKTEVRDDAVQDRVVATAGVGHTANIAIGAVGDLASAMFVTRRRGFERREVERRHRGCGRRA